MRNRILLLAGLILALAALLAAFSNGAPVVGATSEPEMPTVEFLGEGPGEFEVAEGLDFIVKTVHPWGFTVVENQTYTAREGERIWSVTAGAEAPMKLYRQTANFGQLEESCLIQYVVIDNDDDKRQVHLFEDESAVVTLPQTMVVGGEFESTGGHYQLAAEDSIGLWWGVICPTVTPSPSPTATATPTITPTPQPQGGLVYLPFVGGKVEIPSTPTPTITPSPSPTPLNWHWVACERDPWCATGVAPAGTTPYWQIFEDDQLTMVSMPLGRFTALEASGHVVEFETRDWYGLEYIVEVTVKHGNQTQILEAVTDEVRSYSFAGGELIIFVGEGCGQNLCQNPQVWWQDATASGFLADLVR